VPQQSVPQGRPQGRPPVPQQGRSQQGVPQSNKAHGRLPPTVQPTVQQTVQPTVQQEEEPPAEPIINIITASTADLVRGENLIERMNKQSKIVESANHILQSYYGCSIKPTVVSEIINGESIIISPENIMISENAKLSTDRSMSSTPDNIQPDDVSPDGMQPDDVSQSTSPSTSHNPLAMNVDALPQIDVEELKTWLSENCTKKLHDYQLESIVTLRRLELQGHEYCTAVNKNVISNGWLLSLPIGSGKSLVFMALALYYGSVPSRPIITSIDGKCLPHHEQILWKDHPFYYETCGYVEGERNAVIAYKDYKIRKQTIILTHIHLITQMENYFKTDFPGYDKYAVIEFAQSLHGLKNKFNDIDILVIPASVDVINSLVGLSYESPFTRIIVDDYTSMPCVDRFREILAPSTIFVSGSGYNRKASDIPSSYYTLKYAPTSMISLVGDPNKTYAGVFRDCISTTELLGSMCKFSRYEFVAECEETCRGMLSRMEPDTVYPAIAETPKLSSYLPLGFILNNFNSLRDGIKRIENGITTINPKTNTISITPESVSFYLDWKKEIADTVRHPPEKTKNKAPKAPSVNPLYLALYSNDVSQTKYSSQTTTSNISKPIDPKPECLSCKKHVHQHEGFGMISRCCGAFYCEDCLKNMCTHRIIDSKSGTEKLDKNNYYCLSCRQQNPTYFCNMTRKKDSHNVTAINLIDEYFDTTPLEGHNKFDYYFYMFKNGFVPKFKEGPPINVALDIEMGSITLSDLEKDTFVIEQIFPTDQLAVIAIDAMNTVMAHLGIYPTQKPVIIYYGCPEYMEPRVVAQFNEIIKNNLAETQLKISCGKKVEMVQPIKGVTLKFVKSMSELIGLHENVLGIVAWQTPDKMDEIRQLIGRLLRLGSWNNKLYFYISTSSTRYA
jgi:hypothetical protein